MSHLRRTAIVMSRLPRLIDPDAAWLIGLRASIQRVKEIGSLLVLVEGTAGFDFVRRAAERADIPVEFVTADVESDSSDTTAVPMRDRTLVQSAEFVLVLGVRTNGNVHRALRERLDTDGTIELIDLEGLQPKAVREDLISHGARLWSPPLIDLPSSGVSSRLQSPNVIEVVPFPSADEWCFLSHTTRACAGPWPGESVTNYVDSLLDRDDSADHSAVATLTRIIAQQKLIAGNRTIRGGYPMVCLTEVPLANLPNLRQFRTHRTRWDFEPFGFCLRKQWLLDRGARPVIYGSEELWETLSDVDRPFFQRNTTEKSEVKPGRQEIDWSEEREWRHRGDLDFSELGANDGLVFVPNFHAVERLAAVSRWPVTLWPDPSVTPSPE